MFARIRCSVLSLLVIAQVLFALPQHNQHEYEQLSFTDYEDPRLVGVRFNSSGVFIPKRVARDTTNRTDTTPTTPTTSTTPTTPITNESDGERLYEGINRLAAILGDLRRHMDERLAEIRSHQNCTIEMVFDAIGNQTATASSATTASSDQQMADEPNDDGNIRRSGDVHLRLTTERRRFMPLLLFDSAMRRFSKNVNGLG